MNMCTGPPSPAQATGLPDTAPAQATGLPDTAHVRSPPKSPPMSKKLKPFGLSNSTNSPQREASACGFGDLQCSETRVIPSRGNRRFLVGKFDRTDAAPLYQCQPDGTTGDQVGHISRRMLTDQPLVSLSSVLAEEKKASLAWREAGRPTDQEFSVSPSAFR